MKAFYYSNVMELLHKKYIQVSESPQQDVEKHVICEILSL